MKRLAGFLRRARAIYKIRLLEIELQGQIDVLAECDDLETRLVISIARRITQRELVAARQHYHALLPVGQRRTWEVA